VCSSDLEQVQGGHATARSDVFASGAVLHEMLAGRGPFERPSGVDAAHALLHDPPDALPPSTPAALSRVVARCLQKDPAARPADAGELLAELRKIPPQAPRRRRGAFFAAAALALLAAAAIFVLRPRAATESVQPSIAVLPFADLSPQKDQEYFSDGIAEEILNLLAKVPGLHVAARTSAFAFKGKNEDAGSIAGKLHVATILEGSVRKSGEKIRITTQLINAADGYHLWSETYDRKLTDIFAVQDEIGQAVVAALKLKLLQPPTTQERRTVNPEAFNQYLLGKQFFRRSNGDDFQRAVQAYDKALALDPAYAAAWAGLAMASAYAAEDLESAAAMIAGQERALAAAEKAVALGPDLPDGYQARGFLRLTWHYDWDGGIADLQRALALKPDDPDGLRNYCYALLTLGRFREALPTIRKALELDPLNPRLWVSLGAALLQNGQIKEAREAFNRSLEISPQQSYTPYWLGTTYLLDGQPGAALAIFRRSSSQAFSLPGAAIAEHDLGHPAQSQVELDELIKNFGHVGAFQIAEVYAWRGETDRAFEWLERARLQHDGGLANLKVDPLLRKLRGDPRYLLLLKKINLPAE
jgi:TolB-like protein/Tfp pilus assembly protein PilF